MGLFDFWKRKPKEVVQGPAKNADGQGNAMLAMIALSREVLPDINKLPSFFEKHWSNNQKPEDVREAPGIITFQLEGSMVAVSFMNMPIPWTELEGPCATALHWPEATEKMQKHASHLIVALLGSPSDKIDTALLLTKLVAFIASDVDAIGIYWGAGTLVHSPQDFATQAFNMSREYLPLYLWIDFRVNQEDEVRYTLFTTGLKALGFMEIEIVRSQNQPDVLVECAFNIAHYLLDHGPILRHGDTIGMTMDQKIKVSHVSSLWDVNRLVYKLEI